MFDIAFSELVVIGAVALVVIGPQRLPRVARTAGHLLGRMQRFASEIKTSIDREMQLEELRGIGSEIGGGMRELENAVRVQAQELRDELPPMHDAGMTPEPLPAADYLRHPPQEIARNEVQRPAQDD